MQRNRAIATHSISTNKHVRQHFCAFRYFCGTIPSKTVACHSKGVTSSRVIDGQMQRHSAIASRNVPCSKRISRHLCASSIRQTIDPSIRIASGNSCITNSRVINRQMQCHHAVTTCGVGEGVRSGIRAIRVIRVPPCKRVTSHNRCITSRAVVNGEVKSHRAITPSSISSDKRVR